METNRCTANNRTSHTRAGQGPHHLMLGSVAVSLLLTGDQTRGSLSLVELLGKPGSGPGPHVDPWQETFYILDGELTFRVQDERVVRTVVAHRGDVVSIPQGIGHAFSVTSASPAQFLIASTPAGIDAFFADAGEPIPHPALPTNPPAFDRERLRAAFAKHALAAHSFPDGTAPGTAAAE